VTAVRRPECVSDGRHVKLLPVMVSVAPDRLVAMLTLPVYVPWRDQSAPASSDATTAGPRRRLVPRGFSSGGVIGRSHRRRRVRVLRGYYQSRAGQRRHRDHC